MKIAIIGAGVSGLAAAVALAARDHQVTVYERSPELRAAGNGVLIWNNATGILRELGIELDGLGRRMDVADVWSSTGAPLMRTDLTEITTAFGTPCIGVMRGQVIERLAAALPAGTVSLGRECTKIDHSAQGGTLRFADGEEVRADVLIGADGYRSAVRTHLFGEDNAQYTGIASWHGTTGAPLDLGGEHVVPTFYGRDGLCTIHPVAGGQFHWSFEVPFDNGERYVRAPGLPLAVERHSPRTRLERLHEWFDGWTPPVSQLLDVIKEEDIAVAPHTIHEVRKWWGHGPVTLVGDAAHAIPPRAGWGVNQALEDGWAIGHALDGEDDPAGRLRAYEQSRRGRAKKVRGRAKMLRYSNHLLLMLRVTRDGLPSTKMLQANIKNCSSYLNNEVPEVSVRAAA